MNGPIPISLLDLAGAAALILINGLLSTWLRLGLGKRLAVASARTIVQLLLLGYILVPIFRWQDYRMVFGICLLMLLVAARESIRRNSRTYRGAHLNAFLALFVAAGVSTLVGVRLLIGVEPWWQPRYIIPLLGMVLGNGLTGVCLGLDRCLNELDEARSRVEWLLCFGATWWEAARPVVSEALRAGLIPILNTMSVVGIVTIPGMMTGQLLGGTPPDVAARYQILIMFLIASATAMGATLAILLAVRAVFDDQHRLCVDRILRR